MFNNDIESDGFCGDVDNCPNVGNPDQTDSDSDGIGDIWTANRNSVDEAWSAPVNLSETVPFSTAGAGESRPSLSWDGERLVYGSGGVWLSERER